MGQSVFPENIPSVTCLLNSISAAQILTALNPTVHFQVGDINRLPLFSVEKSDKIFGKLHDVFNELQSVRETSVEFKKPGSSDWTYC